MGPYLSTHPPTDPDRSAPRLAAILMQQVEAATARRRLCPPPPRAFCVLFAAPRT